MNGEEYEISHTSTVIYTRLPDGSKAYIRYSVENNVMKLISTYTPPQHRGRGVAGKLMKYAVKLARENKWLIEPICSYAVYFFMKNPGERDVLLEKYRELSDEEWRRLHEEALARERSNEGES
ncbi:GNAT family N-acetyltransferase [Desulfurococcus amylolyticus]|uniref:Predicted acetyltransferase n=1 Tax=Desulfurococcus amylolyticus (strain DSM 18924 / JCM 16383 / VKM B-2413 / 1221n) TaxID=490899 RepID=B8D539_DESA1|nr:GNAT family N-acetyltransferase [Desulfurococcus amylolyticus]ACL11220.1 Predicted acetyltransferase [Desulfurococcus amylolyticus 1221n]